MDGMRVIRHESELGAWTLFGRSPDARLHGLVVEYQDYVETSPGTPILRQEVPTTRIPLIVNFGAAWTVAGSARGPAQAHDSFVAGLGERSSFVAATGAASCVQVNLTPLGAFALLRVAMDEIANSVVSLDDVLGDEAALFKERIADARSAQARFALLDDVFLRRMVGAPAVDDDVAWAWNALEQSQGRAPIGWICDRIGRSRRHLAARFREQVGLAPKTVARIVRFERAVSLLGRGDALADVAFECGYFDQAHLNRDFREFAGTSPASFARQIHPDGGVVL
jgi:AraC-like DNA-binding protein